MNGDSNHQLRVVVLQQERPRLTTENGSRLLLAEYRRHRQQRQTTESKK